MRVRNCVFLGVLIAIWSAGATADMQLNSGLEDDFHFTFKWPGVLHEELNNVSDPLFETSPLPWLILLSIGLIEGSQTKR